MHTLVQFFGQSLLQRIPFLEHICGHVSKSSQLLRFILSLRMNSSFITSRPDPSAHPHALSNGQGVAVNLTKAAEAIHKKTLKTGMTE